MALHKHLDWIQKYVFIPKLFSVRSFINFFFHAFTTSGQFSADLTTTSNITLAPLTSSPHRQLIFTRLPQDMKGGGRYRYVIRPLTVSYNGIIPLSHPLNPTGRQQIRDPEATSLHSWGHIKGQHQGSRGIRGHTCHSSRAGSIGDVSARGSSQEVYTAWKSWKYGIFS